MSRFASMTDDELRRHLAVGIRPIEFKAAAHEAARRFVAKSVSAEEIDEAYEEGFSAGREEGYEEGYEEGREDGVSDAP